MSGIIEKGLKKAGLRLEADALPKNQRTVKSFQRLIAAMRAAEAEVQDRLSDSERQLNEALQKNIELQERVHILESEVLKHRLKEGLEQIPALTVADRTRLLGYSAPNGAN